MATITIDCSITMSDSVMLRTKKATHMKVTLWTDSEPMNKKLFGDDGCTECNSEEIGTTIEEIQSEIMKLAPGTSIMINPTQQNNTNILNWEN